MVMLTGCPQALQQPLFAPVPDMAPLLQTWVWACCTCMSYTFDRSVESPNAFGFCLANRGPSLMGPHITHICKDLILLCVMYG
jgi:hypothetical protein